MSGLSDGGRSHGGGVTPRGDDEHRSVRDRKTLGGYGATEIHFVAHQQVRPPHPRPLQDSGHALPSDPTGITFAHHPILSLHIQFEQWFPKLHVAYCSPASVERLEARLLDRR